MQVLLVEDHPLILEVSSSLFNDLFDAPVIHRALNYKEVQAQRSLDISVVFTDLNLPDCSAEELYDSVGELFPNAKVVFFSSESDQSIIKAIEAKGYLFIPKEANYKDIIAALQKYLGSSRVKTNTETARNPYQSLIVAAGGNKPLTIKQARIMERLCKGQTAKEIARDLEMSPDTVKSHLAEAYSRLGAAERASAVLAYNEARRIAVNLYGEEAVADNIN